MAEARERAIVLAGPEVRAILDGRKTIHRVPISPANAYFSSASLTFWEHANFVMAWVDGKGSPEEYFHVPCHRGDSAELDRLDEHWRAKGKEHGYREQFPDCGPCETCDSMGWRMTSHRLWSRVQPGMRLWVKEAVVGTFLGEGRWRVTYQADGGGVNLRNELPGEPRLRYGMSRPVIRPQDVPRWASRLTLDVLSVRAERLQDITEEEATKEGAERRHDIFHPEIQSSIENPCTRAFAVLWDQKHGRRHPWKSDPWTWAYEIKEVSNA